MTVNYTWKVLTLEVKNESPDHPNAVVIVKWKKTGTDEEGNEACFEGSTPFSAINVSQENYIPFNQLTEETVIGWVKSKVETRIVTGDYTYCEDDTINQYIERQINLARNPVRKEPLPWANN